MKTALPIFALLMALASEGSSEVQVYDSGWNRVERWKDRGDIIEVYNPDWSRKGYIRKGPGQRGRYDAGWNRQATVREGQYGASGPAPRGPQRAR